MIYWCLYPQINDDDNDESCSIRHWTDVPRPPSKVYPLPTGPIPRAVEGDDDDDESYSIRHWTDVLPGEVCIIPRHRPICHRAVDLLGPGHFWRVMSSS